MRPASAGVTQAHHRTGGCRRIWPGIQIFPEGAKFRIIRVAQSANREPELRQLWRDLYNAHADLVLNGHEHSYERFAPQDPYGNLDEKRGIREFVVGTGGRDHGPLGFPISNSQVRNADTFGVLKLTLSSGKYSWEFLPVEGAGEFHDSGTGTCHNEKPPR